MFPLLPHNPSHSVTLSHSVAFSVTIVFQDFPVQASEPKVQLAFYTKPGDCPRKIEIERFVSCVFDSRTYVCKWGTECNFDAESVAQCDTVMHTFLSTLAMFWRSLTSLFNENDTQLIRQVRDNLIRVLPLIGNLISIGAYILSLFSVKHSFCADFCP